MNVETKTSTPLRRSAMALTMLMLFCAGGCGSNKESQKPMPARDINAVMNDHTKELMALPGVTGVAIGQTEDKTPCILVLVEKESEELDLKIPKILEGHPVRLLVSGKIVPMKDS